MKNKILIIAACLLASIPSNAKARSYEMASPDNVLTAHVTAGEQISIDVYSNENLLFSVNDIFLETSAGRIPENYSIKSAKKGSISRTIVPAIKEKASEIADGYSALTLRFRDGSVLEVRLYDDGMAYRLSSDKEGEMTIIDEYENFRFDPASTIYFQKDNNMNSAYEEPYLVQSVSETETGTRGNLPALIKLPSGADVLLMESDIEDYPSMWIEKNDDGFNSHFWNYPKAYNPAGNSKNRRQVTACENFIAKTNGQRAYPWRIFAIAEDDKDLLTNQLVYQLGPECRLDDTSWIRPGWVTFDWWARWGIYGVGFKAGVNTETAKYMIDFASDFGLRYFLFDDGWTKDDDLTKTIDGLDMPEVVRYADSKGVAVMLWVTYDLFDSQMDKAMEQFAKWGIKGLKIDFLNRSDQEISNFYWRAAKKAAEYKMVVDFHGACTPNGIRRAYPNVLTREGLVEFEQNGGSLRDSPDNRLMLPFIRNVAGPMDYIPGTMNNATKNSFRFNGNTPMGPGTRAHFMAMGVIANSPMQMLPDSPSDYYREAECTKFLTAIPTEWDETVPMDCQIGDYVTVARRNGDDWYLASVTDWTPRTIDVDLSFLEKGRHYRVELFKDGVNADIKAIDYKHEYIEVEGGQTISLQLASGGGWVARITKAAMISSEQ